MSKGPVARLIFSLCSCDVLLLAGCALQSTSPATPDAGVAFQGRIHGGQQPVVGASVYLFAVNTTGYGGAGIAASTTNASASLLNLSVLVNNPGRSGVDTSGRYFVTTDSNGAFTITGDYTCTSGQQLYLYAVGGNPGAGVNSAAAFLAALGSCSGITSSTYVFMNEVSTVATAYALAGFATDATHISSSGTTLAQTGVANAMLNAANLASLSTGAALAATPAGNGTVPQSRINSLADILSACVNSTSATSTMCSTLFSTATANGTSTGAKPADTATAALYIAQKPAANVATLFAMSPSSPPFSPALSARPNDWTIAINFAGGTSACLAIDAFGNVWFAGGNTLSEVSSSGKPISGANGYTGGGLSDPVSLAIDPSGNVWASNAPSNSLSKFSSSGTTISGTNGYTGGGLNYPKGIAIDVSGNLWATNHIGNSVSKFSSSGTAISGANGYTGGGLNIPVGPAFDALGNLWVVNYAGNTITELNSSGAFLSGSVGYMGGGLYASEDLALDASGNAWSVNTGVNSLSEFSSAGAALSGSGYTGGGLDQGLSIAIDGSGNVWVANFYAYNLSEFSSSGAALSGSNGFEDPDYFYSGIAIDASGNVWAANGSNAIGQPVGLTELVGAATPVVTPLVANLISPYTHPASKP